MFIGIGGLLIKKTELIINNMTTLQIDLTKRLKSFLWRLGMATLAFIVSWILSNLELLELGTTTTMVLGLLLGEVSKYLNRHAS